MYPMEFCRIQKEKAKRKARELMNLVALPETLINRYPGKLSRGEQQRVAIGRALTMERHLLLADESTGNLDRENSDNIISMLLNLAHEQKKCVLVVTHDLAVMQSADAVFHIMDGTLTKLEGVSFG